MRRPVRVLATLLVVAGAGLLAWGIVTWRWQDPFTALYTLWHQDRLAERYDERLVDSRWRETRYAAMSSAAVRRELRALARRYRASVSRGDAIGRIRTPRLGLDMVLVNGTDSETLKKGPGRHLGSYMPGEGELVYVAGHRTTFSAPFADIDDLRRGDRVFLEVPYGTFEYRVTGRRIVRADAVWVLRSPGHEVVALQACHPRFFASHRYVVYARPHAVTPRGGRTVELAEVSARTGAP